MPGGICVSGAVRDAVKHKIAARYVDMGLQQVKNVAEPVHAWRVRSGGASAPTVAREDDDTMRTAYLSAVPPPETASPTAAFQPTTTQLLRRPSFAVPAAIALLVAMAAAVWIWNRTAGARWAREEAVPESRSSSSGRLRRPRSRSRARPGKACREDPLLERDDAVVRRNVLGDDDARRRPTSTCVPTTTTDGEWQLLGRSPLARRAECRAMPLRWRFEKAGIRSGRARDDGQDDNLGGAHIDVPLQEVERGDGGHGARAGRAHRPSRERRQVAIAALRSRSLTSSTDSR